MEFTVKAKHMEFEKTMDSNDFYKLMLCGLNSLGGHVMSFDERVSLCMELALQEFI